MGLRRQFTLPGEDQRFLDDYGLPWETVMDGSPWVLMHDFPAPEGYTEKTVTLAIRIETGYPPAALDMAYFSPHLKRGDGKVIGATDALQRIDGRHFQRWSRHRTALHPWDPATDNLGTHITLVEDWLTREFDK